MVDIRERASECDGMVPLDHVGEETHVELVGLVGTPFPLHSDTEGLTLVLGQGRPYAEIPPGQRQG